MYNQKQVKSSAVIVDVVAAMQPSQHSTRFPPNLLCKCWLGFVWSYPKVITYKLCSTCEV